MATTYDSLCIDCNIMQIDETTLRQCASISADIINCANAQACSAVYIAENCESFIYDPTNEDDELSTVLDIESRLQMYVNAVASNVVDFNSLMNQFIAKCNDTYSSINFKAFYDTNIEPCQLQISDRKDLITDAVKVLSAFFKKSVTGAYVLKPLGVESKTVDISSFLSTVVFSQTYNLFDEDSYPYIFFGKKTGLIELNDIFVELDNFIDYLDSLRVLDIDMSFISGHVDTILSAVYQYPAQQRCGYAPYAQITQLDIGFLKIDSNLSAIEFSKVEYNKNSIQIPTRQLIRVKNDIIENKDKRILYNVNGKSTYIVENIDYHNEELIGIKEKYKDSFFSNLNIISRKNIFYALNYIFNFWINNMSTYSLHIYACHCNCHSNKVNLYELYANGKQVLSKKLISTIT